MPETVYVYEYVHENYIEEKVAKGWEPVPHVLPVVTYGLATPSTYVFLRKKRRYV